jgi:hypothetical protein
MPLFPNNPFVEGQLVTPALLDQAYNPVFDDQTQYLGHLPRLSDDSLSNAPGQLKDRVAALRSNLVVTAGSGLSVNYTSGLVLVGNILTAITTGNLVLPASSTTLVYVNRTAQVVASNTIPVTRYLLAAVTTNTTGVTNVVDMRAGSGIPNVLPNQQAINVFGGQGEDGAYVATNGDNLNLGSYNFSSFTVGAGVTISVASFAKIKVSGAANIAGTINVVVNPFNILNGVIIANYNGASFGGLPGVGIGSRGGENSAETYSPTQQTFGSDGASSWIGTLIIPGRPGSVASGISSLGGAGGGGLIFEAGGSIAVTSTGIINVNGRTGQNAVVKTTTVDALVVTGATGGGSGGYLNLSSATSCIISGLLRANGESGGVGAADNGTWGAEGGCGGGGGYIQLISPTVNTTNATIQVAGGGADTFAYPLVGGRVALNSNAGSFGGRGGSGSGFIGVAGQPGVVQIKQVTPN